MIAKRRWKFILGRWVLDIKFFEILTNVDFASETEELVTNG